MSDTEELPDQVAHAIMDFLIEQQKKGRTFIMESEIYEMLGAKLSHDAEDRKFVLKQYFDNVVRNDSARIQDRPDSPGYRWSGTLVQDIDG